MTPDAIVRRIAWKDEGPGGPLWINDELVCDANGEAVWYTRQQAEALADHLKPLEYA